jgi:hypothetical protein
MGRLTGRTVILYDRVRTGTDPFNRPVYEDVPTEVDNVLIGSPSAEEIIDTLNLTGKRAAYTLGIPKGDTHVWTDRKVEFFGEVFRTIAMPNKGQEELIPLDWSQNVMVERYE